MKKERNFLIIFAIFFVLGLSFISAGLISNIWVRTTGNAVITNCTQSCSSLGYQCGTANVCGQIVNCGTCSIGYACSSGHCMPQNQTNTFVTNNCIDRDGGINYIKRGDVNNFSAFTFLLREGEMVYSLGKSISIAFINSTSVRFNVDGLIITSLISEGKNYSEAIDITIAVNKINYNNLINYSNTTYATNSVEITLIKKYKEIFSDSCINSVLLKEFYCEGNLTVKNITYDCSREGKVCSNGACAIPPKCVDSDGGLNYYTKGTVTYTYGYASTIANDKSVVIDYCSGSYINEAYCFSDSSGISQFGWNGITCKHGCSNGACKKLLGVFR
jgi:hypothetical protein